ncbi:MAG: glutamine-hydrolyzing carbamoyl-phosphate synthase small subunit [Fimbriimonadaceae bacterium]
MDAVLALADGTCWKGKSLGAAGTSTGELVFTTGMTGYQEVLSDPSFAGQAVVFTYPLIGNTGINDDDFESESVQPTALIAREVCRTPSNWRSLLSLPDYMCDKGIVGIEGVDTRAVTLHIREGGAVMCAVSTEGAEAAVDAARTATPYVETDFVAQVTTKGPYAWGVSGKEDVTEPEGASQLRLVVLDCGLKRHSLKRFAALGVRSIVLPAGSSADEVMSWKPDGVLLSSGPGDPERLDPVVAAARGLLGRVPVFGICLGSQVLARAVGGTTFKLKFGHRGSNHPVRDLTDGSVVVTSQNHGFAIEPGSLDGTAGEVTQINVNDETVEGLAVPGERAFAVQYHPEAAPGPWDSRKYFAQFVEEMKKGQDR